MPKTEQPQDVIYQNKTMSAVGKPAGMGQLLGRKPPKMAGSGTGRRVSRKTSIRLGSR